MIDRGDGGDGTARFRGRETASWSGVLMALDGVRGWLARDMGWLRTTWERALTGEFRCERDD